MGPCRSGDRGRRGVLATRIWQWRLARGASGANPTMGAGGAADPAMEDPAMELQIQLAAAVARRWAQRGHGWARRACPRDFLFFLFFD
jgi:hypothetical protein